MRRRHAAAIATILLQCGLVSPALAKGPALLCGPCPSVGPDVFCVGCGHGHIAVHIALDDVSAGLDAMRRLWRSSGFEPGNLAGCILNATPEAADLRLPRPPILRAPQPPSGDLFRDLPDENFPQSPRSASYLGVEARLDIEKDGTVAAPAVWLDRAFSSEGARSRWPALAPMIATCLQQGLASVRLAPGRPVDSSTVTLSVQVSKTEESWDLPDWLRPANRSGAIPGVARRAWIGGASVLLGGILVAVVVARRRRRGRHNGA